MTTARVRRNAPSKQTTPWTPAHVAYAQKVAISLAVELSTGEPHPVYDSQDHLRRSGNPFSAAARHLGAVGVSRSEVLTDLTQLLRLHGVEPTGTIERALEDHPPVDPLAIGELACQEVSHD